MKSSALLILDSLGRLLLAFGLPIALLFAGASGVVMVMGVATWAVAVALKTPVYRLLAKVIPARRIGLVAARVGIASAILELGLAAAYLELVWRSLSLVDVIAFGAAVGHRILILGTDLLLQVAR